MRQKLKVAIITGAGGTLCSAMAQQEFYVALLGRRLEKLETVCHHILEHGGQAMSFSVDVTDEKALKKTGQRNNIVRLWQKVLLQGNSCLRN